MTKTETDNPKDESDLKESSRKYKTSEKQDIENQESDWPSFFDLSHWGTVLFLFFCLFALIGTIIRAILNPPETFLSILGLVVIIIITISLLFFSIGRSYIEKRWVV
jgi:hypothetical protein